MFSLGFSLKLSAHSAVAALSMRRISLFVAACPRESHRKSRRRHIDLLPIHSPLGVCSIVAKLVGDYQCEVFYFLIIFTPIPPNPEHAFRSKAQHSKSRPKTSSHTGLQYTFVPSYDISNVSPASQVGESLHARPIYEEISDQG